MLASINYTFKMRHLCILQLANHCSIALNQEMLALLQSFAIHNFSTVPTLKVI